ncbi:MAG: DUF3795 domain-containing protein [Bacteroidetes bacterium]|nr:DUF3795 domain-containing protein [Bacteroidota bacterium]
MNASLIAACGMNCGICIGHIRERNKCPGCNAMDEEKSGYCRKCIIKNCPVLKEKSLNFCSETCEKYPCLRLKNLDKRYRTKYGMSMIENLGNIKNEGIEKFVEMEQNRWKCPKCGELLCVHKISCLKCGEKRQSFC